MMPSRRVTRRLTAACVLAVVLLSPALAGARQTPGEVPVLGPGIHNMRFARADGPGVRYAISVPDGYSPSRPVPLVLALHFSGNPVGAGTGMLHALVAPGLAELGAVIVAPDSIAGQWSTPENERAVVTLLDGVQKAYRTDPRRVAVVGFSMGGAGTWFMAGKYPDRFSAAIPMAARVPASADGWRVPVLAVHSRDDEIIPFDPADTRIRELKRAGVRAELIAISGLTHYETARYAEPLKRAVKWLRETWKE